MKPDIFLLRALTATSLLGAFDASALQVLQPDASPHVITPGDDYATKLLGNAWDMNDAVDITTTESTGVVSQAYAGGIFSTITTNTDPGIYPVHPGIGGTVPTYRGAFWPVPTARYRHFTAKVRMTSASGPPLTAAQPGQVIFLRDGNSVGDGSFGFSGFIYALPNQWQIITFDMISQLEPTSPHSWTEYPRIGAIRYDPNAATNVKVEIDWLRLTAPGGTPQQYLVTWSDTTSGSYTVSAIDADGAAFVLGSAIAGTSYLADFSKLAPGNYRVRVERSGATADSPGFVYIDTPPQIAVIAPSIKGEQGANFAANEIGNAWGPIEATNILQALGFASVQYNNPIGSFYGRPNTGDPAIMMQTANIPIDTSFYRSLCFTAQIFGPRDVGLGSVARLFWGNSTPGVLSTSKDIIINEGLNEYCFEDLAAIPMEPGGPFAWSGTMRYLRLDPSEFVPTAICTNSPSPANCRDIRVDSVVLSPFARTNPSYRIRWNLQDADTTSATLTIALDPDRNPDNNNHTVIATLSAALGNGEYDWQASGQVPNGNYYVRISADDSLDTVVQYSGGPLVVAPPTDRIMRNRFE